jgi:hypothetical protein
MGSASFGRPRNGSIVPTRGRRIPRFQTEQKHSANKENWVESPDSSATLKRGRKALAALERHPEEV